MSKRLQIILAAVVATLAGALSQIANTPPELQTQLPQMFPEHYRGIIGLGLKVLMGAATGYASWAALHREDAASLTGSASAK